MAGILIRQLSQHSTRKKASEKDLIVILPDYGPLDIKDYERFKKSSKNKFNEKWSIALTKPRQETASLKDYSKLQNIGSGSFGFVVLVKHVSSKKIFALKCVDKEKVIKTRQMENLKTEKLLLQCINYPFAIYSSNDFKDNIYIYFVLPFVQGGDLYGHLDEIGQGDEDKARFYVSQMILALDYLHYLDFIYRDLKPENILIDHTGYLKLADFGFAKRLKRRLRTYTLCGTPEYIAPEVILNKGYGKAADWWATGCFIYEMVSGRTPFVAKSPEKIYEKVVSRSFKFPKNFSIDLRHLLDNLLQIDLSKRYGNLKNGVSDIKDHKWFVSTNWLAILNRKIEAPYKPKCPSLNLESSTEWNLPKESKEDKYTIEFADF